MGMVFSGHSFKFITEDMLYVTELVFRHHGMLLSCTVCDMLHFKSDSSHMISYYIYLLFTVTRQE